MPKYTLIQPLKLESLSAGKKDQLQMIMVEYKLLTIHIFFCPVCFLKIQKQELGFYIIQSINTAYLWECTLLFFSLFSQNAFYVKLIYW